MSTLTISHTQLEADWQDIIADVDNAIAEIETRIIQIADIPDWDRDDALSAEMFDLERQLDQLAIH